MHCPTCGKPATADQQFCRNCGMNLEAVGKLVVRHTASPEEVQRRIDKAQRDREIARRMFTWMTWGMLVMGIGVVMIVFNKTFDIGKWFKLLATLTTLGGCGIAAGGLLNGMKRGIELSGRSAPRELREPKTQILAESDTPKSFPTNPFPDALPSVTERTTQLINSSELRKQ